MPGNLPALVRRSASQMAPPAGLAGWRRQSGKRSGNPSDVVHVTRSARHQHVQRVPLALNFQGGAHLVPYLLDSPAGLAVGVSAEFEQFAFDQLHDVVKRNLSRGTGEHIAALFTPPAG